MSKQKKQKLKVKVKQKRRRQRGPRPESSVEDQARRIVGRRIFFLAHATVYLTTLMLLLVTAGFLPSFIVALAWGIGLSAHGFFAVLAPELRSRWVEEEARRIRADHRDDRTASTSRHARSLESLSASIAHEIRNPITAAKSLVQQMGEDPTCEENLEYAKVALEELDRVESSISHLLRYAREEPLASREMHVEDVIDSALGTLGSRLEDTDVRVEREVDSPVVVCGDPDKTRQVLINLLSNAIDALEEAGSGPHVIEVAAGRNLSGSASWVRVRDNGPGISPERLDRIFDPFYTSKKKGTGLGLAISRKIVEAQGGSLAVESEVGEGTEFVLELPAANANA